ncbi:hypothetical protein KCP77_11110 [Salmonella enterica subsp. enterica]|nr:hypothetical protein KCP77_11110 [Salmonella enterica subsp. enterica]
MVTPWRRGVPSPATIHVYNTTAVTMMDSEPPTNVRRPGFHTRKPHSVTRYSTAHWRGFHRLLSIPADGTKNERYGRPAPCNKGVSSSYSRVSLPASLSPCSPAASVVITHGKQRQ